MRARSISINCRETRALPDFVHTAAANKTIFYLNWSKFQNLRFSSGQRSYCTRRYFLHLNGIFLNVEHFGIEILSLEGRPLGIPALLEHIVNFELMGLWFSF